MKTMVASLIGVIALTFGLWRQSVQEESRSMGQKEEATIQTGALTEKQKHHSRLYKEYRRDKTIPEQAAESSFDFGVTRGTPLPGGVPGNIQPTFSSRITALGCDADAIVVGKVKSKTSLLTQDQDFIFTDYELTAEEIIKIMPLIKSY